MSSAPQPIPPIPLPGIAEAFALDPSVVYLNHGSFGACPRSVLEVRTRHLFSERLGSDGAVQFGSALEWDRLVGPESTLRTFAGAAYVRFAFDTQYDAYP